MANTIGSCFVIMPINQETESVFTNVYVPAIEEAKLEPKRADSIFGSKEIMHDIYTNIKLAKVLIADLTDLNANVFYELGLAHAIVKPVVLIAEKIDDVPFDLRHLRILVKSNDDIDLSLELRNKLSNILKEAIENPDSFVPEMYKSIEKNNEENSSSLTISPAKAIKKIESLVKEDYPRSYIIEELAKFGYTDEEWILSKIRGAERPMGFSV